MIITDIRRHFFDRIKGRILIMSALDVDAICACKILQFLFESFNLQYTVSPVSSIDNLSSSFEEYRNSVDAIVLINFGNSINLAKLLKPAEHQRFYVIDSHRPINVYNYYKSRQIRIYLNKDESDLNVPDQKNIFLRNDTGEEVQNEEESLALLQADARSLTSEQLQQRRKLREWLSKKQSIMFDYEEFNFYNRPVSIIIYDLAHQLAKSNNYLLWLGIVGLTYQLKSDKIEQESFEKEAETLIRYISRNQVSSNHAKGNTWRISWQKDLQLDLYRKWTLFDSICNTPLTVCSFQLWNDKGSRNLLEFLVDCGLKLQQCKSRYVAMDLQFKSVLLPEVSRVCLDESIYKYNLQELIGRGFVLNCGFNHKNDFAASDIMFSLRAQLECFDTNTNMTEKFVRAIQSLTYDEFTLMDQGFDAAKQQLESMFQQVQFLLTNYKVTDAGSFLHVDLQDVQESQSCHFTRGESLMSFARFLLRAYVASKTTRLARRAVILPLIIMCPDAYDHEKAFIAGIPPLAQQAKKNFFGKAFEQAAANIECEIKSDLSEPNLIRVNIDYKSLLLEQIKLLLQ